MLRATLQGINSQSLRIGQMWHVRNEKNRVTLKMQNYDHKESTSILVCAHYYTCQGKTASELRTCCANGDCTPLHCFSSRFDDYQMIVCS